MDPPFYKENKHGERSQPGPQLTLAHILTIRRLLHCALSQAKAGRWQEPRLPRLKQVNGEAARVPVAAARAQQHVIEPGLFRFAKDHRPALDGLQPGASIWLLDQHRGRIRPGRDCHRIARA